MTSGKCAPPGDRCERLMKPPPGRETGTIRPQENMGRETEESSSGRGSEEVNTDGQYRDMA